MKEKIQKFREFLTDASKAVEAGNADEIVGSIASMMTLADEMHAEAEKTEEKISSLEKSASPGDIAEKIEKLTEATLANKSAIEKFAEAYSEDTEALAETLTKMSRAKPSKQNDDEGGSEDEKQPLSKKIFNF